MAHYAMADAAARFAARITAATALLAPFRAGAVSGEDDDLLIVGWEWPSRVPDWHSAVPALRNILDTAHDLLARGGADAESAARTAIAIARQAAEEAWRAAQAAGSDAAEELGRLYREAQAAFAVTPLVVAAVLLGLYLVMFRR